MIRLLLLLQISLITFGVYVTVEADHEKHIVSLGNYRRMTPFYFRRSPAGYSCTCMHRKSCVRNLFVSGTSCPIGKQCCLNNKRDYVEFEVPANAPRAKGGEEYSYEPYPIQRVETTYYKKVPNGFTCICKSPIRCDFAIFITSKACGVTGEKCCLELLG